MNIFDYDTSQHWKYENGFYLTSNISRLGKLIAQYELYKTIIDLPGEIVECGVFKGASFIRLISFRDLLENPLSRRAIGFDAFGSFPGLTTSFDKKITDFNRLGGNGISISEMENVLKFKAFSNYELVPGDICDTLPKYVAEHPELKVSFLHIDVDTYEPSRVILHSLYDRVVRGGILLFDDFATIADETRAIDEFINSLEESVVIKKLSVSSKPAYIRKE